jgi:hypothetical protein
MTTIKKLIKHLSGAQVEEIIERIAHTIPDPEDNLTVFALNDHTHIIIINIMSDDPITFFNAGGALGYHSAYFLGNNKKIKRLTRMEMISERLGGKYEKNYPKIEGYPIDDHEAKLLLSE